MHLTLDHIKTIQRRCEQCSEFFDEVKGAIFDDGQPIGFFTIALHGHSPEGRVAHLAIAVCSLAGDAASVALAVTANAESFQYRFLDWHDSPWNSEDLENMLDRDAALRSEFRTTFLHAADHVTRDLRSISQYFSNEPQG